MTDLVIRNAVVVTADAAGTVIDRGGVAVAGGRLTAVAGDDGLAPLVAQAVRVIDAGGAILMPGLINTHCHLASALFRGLVEDLPLEPWLQTVWKAEAAILTDETSHLGALLGLAELALGGVTTVCDMWWHPDRAVEAARAVGVRIATGGILFDFPGVTGDSVERRFEKAEAFLRDHAGAEDVIGAVLPHGAYTVAPDHLVAAKRLADRHGAVLTTHAAETQAENADVLGRHGRTVVRHLDHLGLLDARTLLAHVVHPDAEEIEILARSGAQVAHNPVSNLKLASGIAPVPAMMAAGVGVSLGTDGAVSGNDMDMWLALRLAGMLHKGASADASVMPRADVLRMATAAGARALGVADRLGTLEVGKAADMVVVGLDGPHAVPLFDPVTHLVYAANRHDVRDVFVGGRQVVDRGRLTGVDLADIRDRVTALAPRVAASVAG